MPKKKIGLFYFTYWSHYDEKMDKFFFKDLEIVAPKYNLKVGSQPYEKQIGAMVKKIIFVLEKEKPDVVLVEGDTSSVLAGALAANKLGIKLATKKQA